MYLLFRLKKWKPNEYYNLGIGEKKIIKAFLRHELEEKAEEQENIFNNLN